LLIRLRQPGAGVLFDGSDPAFYAGVIEAADYRSSGGMVSLHAGSLVQETLGHGVLVERYTARHDPTVFRTGGRVDVNLPRFSASALVDSFIRPHVVAASFRGLPLAMVGMDPSERFALTLEAAADLQAPHGSGKRPLAALDLDLGFNVWKSAELAFEIYVAGAAFTTSALGAHAGVQVEWRGRGHDTLVFRFETVAGSDGYFAGFFDEAYSMERFAVPARGWLPKAEQRPAGAVGARGTLDARIGPARFGVAATLAHPRRPGTLSLFLRLSRRSWTVAAALHQRHLSDGSDLVRIGPASNVHLDGSVNLFRGLFAFSQVRHTLRRPTHGELEPVFDLLLGLGYGAQAGHNPGS
jgi:hypothetical protein